MLYVAVSLRMIGGRAVLLTRCAPSYGHLIGFYYMLPQGPCTALMAEYGSSFIWLNMPEYG